MSLPATCIATVCLSGTLPDKLDAASRAGFDAVEIFENDLLGFDGTPDDVRMLAEDLGLSIALYQPFRDFEGVPATERSRALDRAEKKFDVMDALGTDLILVCSNVRPDTDADPARAADDLSAMADRAAARGLRVGYEALAWGRHVSRWRQAWDIVKRADHPALGLIVDSFHTLALDDDAAGLRDIPGERIFFAQLADAPRLSLDVLNWSRHFRSFPGQGDLDVTGFVRALLASGYTGPLSLEVFNDEFRAAPAGRIARDGLRSLRHVTGALVPAAALPPPPLLAGIAFVEFALDPPAAAELGSFLAPLGFVHAGRHRSKQVDLYRQGAVNLVLNAEPDSAAAEHFALHGPAVCAIGLSVTDAAPALARAQALLAPIWRERRGADERAIPALRAPDGMLIHLVSPHPSGRSIWQDDFQLTDAADGGLLTGIDHIAHAVAPGQMDGFVLFHRAVLGLAPDPVFELPDPYGIVLSRALHDPSGNVRLPLNVSQSGRTGTGRFVTALGGAGVHHIAFAAADATRAARVAGAAGAPILPIPQNYIADLAARFGPDEAGVAMGRRPLMLQDRDASGGEFLHAYTDPFQERFFFEIAERRRGYAGYGAANAAIRLAAQARRSPG